MSLSSHRPGLIAAGLVLAATLVGVSAIAQNAPATDQAWQPGQGFAARDANHDGFIDKSEASQRLADRFDTIDSNHDGKISPDELKAAWQGHHGHGGRWHHHDDGHFGGEGLARLDTDHDGKLSLAEMTARATARFDRLDTNHDGFVDATEMAAGGGHKNWRHGDGSSATGR